MVAKAEDPNIGREVGVGASFTTIDGVEYVVDEKTGKITGVVSSG